MIDRVRSITWTIDGRPVLEERSDGTYQIVNWFSLDRDELERLHLVLGALLTEPVSVAL
jgi:hypothetical protein